MKKLIILSALFLASFSLKAQTVQKTPEGNYIAVKATRDSAGTSAKPTGKTFTTSKGEVYPVMLSKNGKLFVIRTSKATGRNYNQYLKP